MHARTDPNVPLLATMRYVALAGYCCARRDRRLLTVSYNFFFLVDMVSSHRQSGRLAARLRFSSTRFGLAKQLGSTRTDSRSSRLLLLRSTYQYKNP